MVKAHLYRTLKPEFAYTMDRRGGWPDHKTTAAWMKAHGYCAKRDPFSRLRHSEYVHMSHAENLIDMLLAPDPRNLLRDSKRVLLDYCTERGIPSLDIGSREHIVSHTCTPIVTSIPPAEEETKEDWFLRGLQDIAMVPAKWAMAQYFRMLASECRAADPAAAASWSMIRLAQARLPNGHQLTNQQAIQAAAEILHVSEVDLSRRIHAWANVNRWTALAAHKHGQAVGISILLPLTASAYDEIRAGRRPSFDIDTSDIAVPSNDLVFLALAENPELLSSGNVNPTRPMRNAVLIQHGALMRYGHPRIGRRYRLMAPEATPSNRDRMSATGYRFTGNIEDRTSFPLWERIIDFATGEGSTIIDLGACDVMSRTLPSSPDSA